MRWLLVSLLSILTLATLVVAVFLIAKFHTVLPVLVGLVVVGAILFWVFGSVFSPAVPDRKCPRCGEDALARIRKDQMLGVHCENCDFEDENMYRAYLDEI